jgi:hypothetical protein
MGTASQAKALQNYRARLGERGLARFEVLGLDRDRALIRALAKKLARNDADAAALRAEVARHVAGTAPPKGGILAALRRSPLVGADLDLRRSKQRGRRIKL